MKLISEIEIYEAVLVGGAMLRGTGHTLPAESEVDLHEKKTFNAGTGSVEAYRVTWPGSPKSDRFILVRAFNQQKRR